MNIIASVRGNPNRVRLRVEDVALLDATGAFTRHGKIELIDGELLSVNAQYRPHMFAKDEIAYRLRRALEAMGSALYVGTEASVHLSDHDLPQPDILLTSEPRGGGPVPGNSIRLLIEVADTTIDHDLGRKAALYAQARVGEYWVVDINDAVVHQMAAPQGSDYTDRRTISFGERIEAITIHGLTVPTDRL